MPQPTGLSFRDLRSFLAVVEEGTFTDAAIRLGTTQASVSRHIGALERELGVRLLQRGGRVVTLTTTGRAVLRHARAIREEVEALRRVAADEDREIRVGYAWAALGAHTATVQREWARRHPGTELIFVNSTSRLAGLTEGLADVGVVRREPRTAGIGSALLGHEDRVAALPAQHPLARRRGLRMADFVGETLALDIQTGTTTAELWTPQQAPAAYREVHGTDEWLTVIAAGQALGLSSRATSAQYSRVGIVFRPVRDAPRLPVWLVWWREDPPWFVDELVALIRAEYGRPG
ncbi:LysR family transcriptional regulator [Ornithinimicrobium sp. Y1847]|uniref:LysR family transcriptional regulator n=1 Tax=Ornithinimicrobium sp. Y1847 TaxID=3405419 RepID=UPI003B66C6C0